MSYCAREAIDMDGITHRSYLGIQVDEAARHRRADQRLNTQAERSSSAHT
jgi:hypothetical protein